MTKKEFTDLQNALNKAGFVKIDMNIEFKYSYQKKCKDLYTLYYDCDQADDDEFWVSESIKINGYTAAVVTMSKALMPAELEKCAFEIYSSFKNLGLV